jgi:transcriptional regulator GlxA family with amidase domain
VIETDRFIDNGRILTAAGISAGIDMSLHLVARLHGVATAQKSARYMEYHPAMKIF